MLCMSKLRFNMNTETLSPFSWWTHKLCTHVILQVKYKISKIKRFSGSVTAQNKKSLDNTEFFTVTLLGCGWDTAHMQTAKELSLSTKHILHSYIFWPAHNPQSALMVTGTLLWQSSQTPQSLELCPAPSITQNLAVWTWSFSCISPQKTAQTCWLLSACLPPPLQCHTGLVAAAVCRGATSTLKKNKCTNFVSWMNPRLV